jgi:hypothetical protein
MSPTGTLPTRVVAAADEFVRDLGNRLAQSDPRLKRGLLYAREAYAHAFVRGVQVANAVRYRAPPDPYRLLRVDPASIERVAEYPVSKFRMSGVVRDGDWDRTDERFEDTDVFRAYRRHFREGVPWAETDFFERVVGEIEAGNERWGCASRSDFVARCRRLDRLYESIRENGYRTQAELGGGSVEDPVGRRRLRRGHLADEIAVHVDRNGEFIFEDGRNRLSIVKLLDLDEIPVRVLLRHREWQSTRDAYVRGWIDPENEVVDHPDLRALAPSSD